MAVAEAHLGWMGTSVDKGASIKNAYNWVEIDSRPDYSARSRVLKWRSRSVAKSAYQSRTRAQLSS